MNDFLKKNCFSHDKGFIELRPGQASYSLRLLFPEYRIQNQIK